MSPPTRSDNWATPHAADVIAVPDAFAVPTDERVVLVDVNVVAEREPLGIGEPLAQVAELALTGPPAPVPVEKQLVVPVAAFSCSVPDEVVVLGAVSVALKPVAPAGVARLKSTASETPPAASFLHRWPRRLSRANWLTGRMVSIGGRGRVV